MFDSVAKDFGFPDVDTMLADLPSEGEDPSVLLHDRSAGWCYRKDFVLIVYSDYSFKFLVFMQVLLLKLSRAGNEFSAQLLHFYFF